MCVWMSNKYMCGVCLCLHACTCGVYLSVRACMHACVCVVCAGQVMLSIGLRRGDICEERVCM